MYTLMEFAMGSIVSCVCGVLVGIWIVQREKKEDD